MQKIKFKTILADPPWTFNDKLDPTRKKPYETLTIEKLKKLPVEKIAEDEAHLYLWCPTTLLPNGFELVESWGFDYKTIVVWGKLTKHGKRWFGMGRYFRNCVEMCIFATKKNLILKTKNTRNFFDAKKPDRHHAAKPYKLYTIIEDNSYGPYIELFATVRRVGWISLGDEVNNGQDIRESLKIVLNM